MHKPRILCTLAALLILCAALALPVSAGQPGGMEAPEDLAQKSVGVVTGAIYDQVLTARVPDARVNYFNNHTDEVAALLAGKIDALVTDEPMARYIVSQSPGLRILPEMFQQDSYAFAFPQDRAALRDEVNGALEQLRADGTLQQIDAAGSAPTRPPRCCRSLTFRLKGARCALPRLPPPPPSLI